MAKEYKRSWRMEKERAREQIGHCGLGQVQRTCYNLMKAVIHFIGSYDVAKERRWLVVAGYSNVICLGG